METHFSFGHGEAGRPVRAADSLGQAPRFVRALLFEDVGRCCPIYFMKITVAAHIIPILDY